MQYPSNSADTSFAFCLTSTSSASLYVNTNFLSRFGNVTLSPYLWVSGLSGVHLSPSQLGSIVTLYSCLTVS